MISLTTKISLRTVKYNIAKIKQQGKVEDRSRSGHLPSMITRHLVNKQITTKELTEKLLQTEMQPVPGKGRSRNFFYFFLNFCKNPE